MRYLIDGYNFLFRTAQSGRTLQNRREELIQRLIQYTAKRRERVTLVFDAPMQADEESRSHLENLEIVYTAQGQSADEYMLHVLQIVSNPLAIVVVTSDRRLARMVHSCRGKTLEIEEFLSRMEKHQASLRKKPLSAIPDSEMDRWLQLFEKRMQDLGDEN